MRRVALAVALAAALVGLVAISLRGADPPTTRGIRLTGARGVALMLPADWRRVAPPGALRRLGLVAPVAAQVEGLDGGIVVARVSRPRAATLLPAAVGGDASPASLAFGANVAWRYNDVLVPGLDGRLVAAYAIPVVAGAPVVAFCDAPPATAAVLLPECEGVLAGARLPAGAPLDPDPAYARSLAARLGPLARVADALAARISGTGAPGPRVAPARALAAAYSSAARSLGDVRPTPGARAAHGALRRGLARLGGAYAGLAGALAARRRDGVARAVAKGAVMRRRVARARAELGVLGYRDTGRPAAASSRG